MTKRDEKEEQYVYYRYFTKKNMNQTLKNFHINVQNKSIIKTMKLKKLNPCNLIHFSMNSLFS